MIIYITESRIAHFIGIDGHRVKNFDSAYGTRSFILNHLRVADENGIVWVPVELRHMDANSKTERLARLAPVQRFLEHIIGTQYIAFKWPPFESQHEGIPENLDPAFSRRPEEEFDVDTKTRNQSTREFRDDDTPQAVFDRMCRSSDNTGISLEALKLKQQLKSQRERKEQNNHQSRHGESQVEEPGNDHVDNYQNYAYPYDNPEPFIQKLHACINRNDKLYPCNGQNDASSHKIIDETTLRKRQNESTSRKRQHESLSPEITRHKKDYESRESSRHHRSSHRSRSHTRSSTWSPSPSRRQKSRRAQSYSSSCSPSPRRCSSRRSDRHRDRSSRRSRHDSRSRNQKKESPVKTHTSAKDKGHIKDYDIHQKEQDEKCNNRFRKYGNFDADYGHARSDQNCHGKNKKRVHNREAPKSSRDGYSASVRPKRDNYDAGYHYTEVSTMILEVPALGKVNESRLKMMMAEESDVPSDGTFVSPTRHT